MCKALELTDNLFNASENIRTEWKDLHNELSIVDQKKSDIEHFIELNSNLSASQGYKVYKLLKEVLEERRVIKNQIEELKPPMDFINGVQLTNPKNKTTLFKDIKKRYNTNSNEVERKKYNVRILTDVFGDVIRKQQ